MNIQEYISSGIVESYVLGLASEAEQREFEQLCAQYPELVAARDAFERQLEQQALGGAVLPPASAKENIWKELGLNQAPVKQMPVGKTAPLTPVRRLNWLMVVAAASVILLLGSTILNFYFYTQYRTSNSRLEELTASIQQMANNNQVMQAKLQQYSTSLETIRDTNMAIIAMKGMPNSPQSKTTVYWDRQSKDVYLLVNSLPHPAAGKQYQLWAIVDNKPVSAGMIDMDSPGGMLVKMANVPHAQAFAITLENSGGSKTPTMPIYVMGQI